ncbi:NAD(P)-dependent oxidoreductase [Dokdonia sp. PRO95]|uniref:NAD-dependent epimerase/dehydratase family protein n=1 Tax=Dokdonia sp. PRO95 TaxID=1239415 RepID=UPI000550D622|nr:NAD(P)-dependent oxidoreductase [Dokdonia sp. PRO95]
MNIIVTGASGFLGRYVLNELSHTGHTVKAIGRSKNKLIGLSSSANYTFAESDYSLASLLSEFKGFDTIIHLASEIMQRNTDKFRITDFNNIELFQNVLLAAKQNDIKKVIQTSTISVYSEVDVLNTEENCKHPPKTIYGLSKYMCDIYAEYFRDNSDVEVLTLRLARLYGYGDRETVIFEQFVNKAINKEPLTIFGDGSSTIEYVYVKDVSKFIVNALNYPKVGGIYNLGFNYIYSLKEIALAINLIFKNPEPVLFPKPNFKNTKGVRMNSNKLTTTFDYKSNWSLLKSLKDLALYYN